MIKVLVVDDDPMFRRGISTSLRAAGYSVDDAKSASEALFYVRNRPIDILLLDINMPGISGIDACQRLRAIAPQAGIIMLTVRDAEDDKVQALEMGADDYITKPFRLRELIARIQALSRRTGVGEALTTPVVKIGELELELEHRTLRRNGSPVHLSPKEFDLLAFLMQHRDVPVTHAKLLRALWGPEYGGELEYLRSYIKMIRKKIETDPSRPTYIVTEPRVGYRFRDPGISLDLQLGDEDDDPELED